MHYTKKSYLTHSLYYVQPLHSLHPAHPEDVQDVMDVMDVMDVTDVRFPIRSLTSIPSVTFLLTFRRNVGRNVNTKDGRARGWSLEGVERRFYKNFR